MFPLGTAEALARGRAEAPARGRAEVACPPDPAAGAER
jgi:hypothetical protein